MGVQRQSVSTSVCMCVRVCMCVYMRACVCTPAHAVSIWEKHLCSHLHTFVFFCLTSNISAQKRTSLLLLLTAWSIELLIALHKSYLHTCSGRTMVHWSITTHKSSEKQWEYFHTCCYFDCSALKNNNNKNPFTNPFHSFSITNVMVLAKKEKKIRKHRHHNQHSLDVLGDSGGVVNSLDFCPAPLKSLGCFYFQCVLSSQWKAVTVNLRILHSQL